MNYLTIILVVLAAIVVWLIAAFNSLVRRRTRVDEGWADIDVQLKRRYDLIPNLVATVKGYATPTLAVGEGILPTWAKAALIGVVGVGGAWLILRPKRA